MDVSTGTRSFLKEIASWTVTALFMAAVLINFDYLKGQITGAMGIPPPGQNSKAPANTNDQSAGGSVVLRASDNGHFETSARINGRSVDVLVDTGATLVALTYEDARRAGLSLADRDFTGRSRTANGVSRVAPVRLDKVTIGSITVRDVDGVVAEEGKLFKTLLGMSFLSRLDQVDMRSGKLVLKD